MGPVALVLLQYIPAGEIAEHREVMATALTSSVCCLKQQSCAPSVRRQVRAVLSSAPVTTKSPSGLTATAFTLPVCPSRRSRSAPVAASQIRAVLSQLPVTTNALSALIATAHGLVDEHEGSHARRHRPERGDGQQLSG